MEDLNAFQGPTWDRIKCTQDKYKKKYQAYRERWGKMNRNDWARTTHATVRPDPCCIMLILLH